MRPSTAEFLHQRFLSYYAGAQIPAPDALSQREWGFLFFSSRDDPRMRRHIGFGTKDELVEYLRTMAPAHVFYSTAYYDDPAAPTMSAKGWAGADLIFDLDADHILKPPFPSYPAMLSRVRDETRKLIDLLVVELGFAEHELQVVFSGGRGYHIHVKALSVRQFTGQERRELINYVCGIGLDPALLLRPAAESSGGWHGRQLRALEEYLDWLESLGESEALAHLQSIPDLGRGMARQIWKRRRSLFEMTDASIRKVLRPLLSEGNDAWRSRIREAGVMADEPVTTDIKRLIRAPGSLHGGTGLRVTVLEPRELEAFDPLIEGVVFAEREIPVEVVRDCRVSLLDHDLQFEPGPTRVPEAVAVYLCSRGMAEVGGVAP
ncbi:MAG: DNA primase catalytic subunit PriS [Methanospirillum sp.]|mgnify:CR=1 FL=1|nr:DNA primase catalytic subunit PriS [Methanospirillum sp.]